MRKYLLLLFIPSLLLAMEEDFSISETLSLIPKVSFREKRELLNKLEDYLDKTEAEILPKEDLLALKQYKKDDLYFYDDLRLYLDIYLQQGIESISKNEAFENIKNILVKDKHTYDKVKSLGRHMLKAYYTPSILKKVHRSNDQDLIDLFNTYLPLPSSSIFNDGMLPFHIAKITQEKQSIIDNFWSGALDKKDSLKNIIYIQRSIRKYYRKNEQEANTIKLLADSNFSKEAINQALIDIDYPYVPKCAKDLALKIVKAASMVKLWPKVSHLTDPASLASIFDEGLMGRRDLRSKYKCFKPAALYDSDIKNGDGNIICLGPDKIDDQCYKQNTAKIVFDFTLLREEKNLPCCYKTRDLGFTHKYFQQINLGDLRISFNQRNQSAIRNAQHNYSYFIVVYRELARDDYMPSKYPPRHHNCLHIFHNLSGLDMILTLYPFIYIDQLGCLKDDIYKALAGLNEAELIEALTDLGTKATDTAEFNIYGCYLPSIDSILAINLYDDKELKWEIKLNELYQELNHGIPRLFDRLKNDMPSLLKSHRFMDHLLSKIDHEASRAMILELSK